MTFELSKGLQLVDPTYTNIYDSFDHLTVAAEFGKAPGQLWYPNGVAIDPATNNIYVAEGTFPLGRVSLFSESGDFLNSYTDEHMAALIGIAIHENNVYVTDYVLHAVFHLKIETYFRLVARRGSRGPDIGQFNYLRQVSTSTIGDVYIADRDNNRIQILDSSLHPIREVAHPSMHKPCDLKLTEEELYVLSPEDSPCVHVFTHIGHKIRSLITCCEGMQVTLPEFFCLDIKKNLIISDWDSDQIKIFSNEGAHINTIGEFGDQVGMFDFPRGLALTSNLKLVTVSWNFDYTLQIFSPL